MGLYSMIMVSLWQRAFNILVIILALYFFWLTANYRAILIVQQKVDNTQTAAISEIQKKLR
jgi:hypothetical protein